MLLGSEAGLTSKAAEAEGPDRSRVAQSGAEGKLGSHPVQAWPFTRGKTEARRGKIEGLLFPRELVAEQELELRSPESRSSSTGS